jgi:hypothetical protein
MTDNLEILRQFPILIQGFDHFRACKYDDLDKLLDAIDQTQTSDLVKKHLQNWQVFKDAYQTMLSRRAGIMRTASTLKVFEVSVLATYVTLLGINLFSEVSWMSAVLPWATVIVLIYFGFVYGVTFFAVEKPAERFLKRYHQDNKKFAKGLYKLVYTYIERLDQALLQAGLNAGDFGLQLYAKDYPGIFVTTKPGRVVGDRFFRAVPYPLHSVFAETRSRINVLMINYRDDRLLRALADIPGKFQLSMVTTSNITSHGIFQRAIADILEKNKYSSVSVIPSKRGRKAVVVFTVDGVWQLDFGRALTPSELKYKPVEEGAERMDFEILFNEALERGEKFKP